MDPDSRYSITDKMAVAAAEAVYNRDLNGGSRDIPNGTSVEAVAARESFLDRVAETISGAAGSKVWWAGVVVPFPWRGSVMISAGRGMWADRPQRRRDWAGDGDGVLFVKASGNGVLIGANSCPNYEFSDISGMVF